MEKQKLNDTLNFHLLHFSWFEAIQKEIYVFVNINIPGPELMPNAMLALIVH